MLTSRLLSFRALLRRIHAPIYSSRLNALVHLVIPHISQGDRVLDVGCGFGELGRAIIDSPACPDGVVLTGLELNRRPNELIPVDSYDGRTIPFGTRSYDVVLLADVLHHALDPNSLLGECVRVARRSVLIKDHKLDGLLAQQRLAFIDWAANWPYGVDCIYRYNSIDEWSEWLQQHEVSIEQQLDTLRIYPPFINIIFGGRLHYWVALRHPSFGEAASFGASG